MSLCKQQTFWLNTSVLILAVKSIMQLALEWFTFSQDWASVQLGTALTSLSSRSSHSQQSGWKHSATQLHGAERSHIYPEGLTNARAQNSTGSPEIVSRQMGNLLVQTSMVIVQCCKIKALGRGVCLLFFAFTWNQLWISSFILCLISWFVTQRQRISSPKWDTWSPCCFFLIRSPGSSYWILITLSNESL